MKEGASKIKQQMDSINALQAGMEEFVKKIPALMTPFAEEQRKLLVPKAKKDVQINGKSMAVSLLEDGRVIIHAGTMDEAQYVFDNVFDIGQIEWHFKQMENFKRLYIEEKNKPWYEKLFGK